MTRLKAAWLSAAILFTQTAAAEIVLPQASGGTLVLEQPATRIISLAPNLAELLYAAGAGDRLVATVEFTDFPPAALQVPRIGDAFRFDLERIVEFAPDLVLGWASGNPDAALRRLDSLGLEVWRIEIRQPGDVATVLEAMARATGRLDVGLPAADEFRQRLAKLTARHAGTSPVRYFYQVSPRPLFTLNGEHLVSRGLALCGGRNVFADEPVLAPQVTLEAVLVADPAVLIAPVLNADEDPLAQWRDWPRLAAARNGAFIHLPADEISRATPRLLDSLESACTLLDQFRRNDRSPDDE
jgi:iron complex transport system substrate-binding protein